MRKVSFLAFAVAAGSTVVMRGPTLQAVPALVWSTTFNCNEWNQSLGLAASILNCDGGVSGFGAWATSGHPLGDQITLAANYPGGGGGRGFRHWRGDGTNNNGGGVGFSLPAVTREMWIRFYMRYQQGFGWTPSGTPNYTKDMYWHGNSFTLGFHSSNSWGVSIISPSANWYGSPGFQGVMGGPTADGSWHCYEAHVKMDTNHANGIAEGWIDNKIVSSYTNVDWNSTGGWQDGEIGDNQAITSNGGDVYTDYDDFAISVVSRVGCIGTATSQPPAAPLNVKIIK